MIQRIAIPTANGHICAHFGHCEAFTVVETEDGKVTSSYFADPPEHQPGTYPKFLVSLVEFWLLSSLQPCPNLAFRQPLLWRFSVQPVWPLASGGNLCDH